MIELFAQFVYAWFFVTIILIDIPIALMVSPLWLCILLVAIFIYPYSIAVWRFAKYVGKQIEDEGFNVLSVLSVIGLMVSKFLDMSNDFFWEGMEFKAQQIVLFTTMIVFNLLFIGRYLLEKFK